MTKNKSPKNGNHNQKKRKRSPSKDDTGSNMVEESIVPHVITWLEKRKKQIPDSLKNEDNIPLSIDHILSQLSLKERERRALIRHVEKCVNNKNNTTNNGDSTTELEGSDNEYDIQETKLNTSLDVKSSDWPSTVEFSNNYRWSNDIPKSIKDQYTPSNNNIRQRANRLSNRVYFKKITDPNHPAHGQFGLYCALDHAKPGSWLLDYVGHISLGEDQDKTSDYVSDFGEKSELACDANTYGNEARFLNDYRNTGSYPNVEFNKRRDANGELRQGVFVREDTDSRVKPGFDGVRKDEELLVR